MVFLLAAMALSLSGCAQQRGNMKADIFESSTQQHYLVLDAMAGQKPLYDKAYDKAKNYFTPESPVRGAVIAANLKSKEELAGFFQRLEKTQHYQTIVVLNAVKFPQKIAGTASAIISPFTYKTPYGLLNPDSAAVDRLSKTKSIFQDASFAKGEAWPKIIAPFVAKSFHGSSFLPVFINEDILPADAERVATALLNALPQDSLVIAQSIPKTSTDTTVAEFQLKFTETVLENFDTEKLSTLPLNNSAAIGVLEKYLGQKKSQRMQNQFQDSGSGNFLSFAMEGPLYQSRSVSVVAFGDLMFDRVVRNLMDSHSLEYPLEKMDRTYLKNNDILVANLEGPIAKKKMQTSKAIAFRFNPDIVQTLKKYYFDALSEANNHAADMGWTGFNDTFELLAPTGIKVFGNPKEIEDRSTATFDIQGQKIAFLGLEEVVYTIDDAKAVAKIKELTAQGYKVIPFMHWGIEYQHRPNSRQQDLAHKFIDAGAVAVIGCHPHVVQSFEIYKNHPVFYSLGNAIFDQYFSPDTQEGLSIAMNIANDQIQIYFFPIKIDRSQFRLMNADERKKFMDKFAGWGEYSSEEERQNVLAGKITLGL